MFVFSLNSLKGKRVLGPTKKGCLGGKSYLHQLLKLDARCSGLKLKANNNSHLKLQYCCVGFLHYTRYCCPNWLVKLADIFLQIYPRLCEFQFTRAKRQIRDNFGAGLRACQPQNLFSFFLSCDTKWRSMYHVKKAK